uniref:Uncharacterized protein n=1 Tax=Anguilla anguilla TaxID=7936 RepID=A0A0E9UXB9_ANGAN
MILARRRGEGLSQEAWEPAIDLHRNILLNKEYFHNKEKEKQGGWPT